MGFALWRQPPLLICAGTHEYRPLGTAVVGDQDLFTPRDFSPRRTMPRRGQDGFVGYFASLEEVNRYLRCAKPRVGNHRNAHRLLAALR
jgi:hypothetical protein